MAKSPEQRVPTPSEITTMAKTFRRKHPDDYGLACCVVDLAVDAEAYYRDRPSIADQMQLSMAFSEWLVYDYELDDGKSLIRSYARKHREFREFAKTQFYARFWVISQDPERDLTQLRDMNTHGDFWVTDASLARKEQWQTGTLGMRIAQVGGIWYYAGQLQLHDVAPSDPAPCDEEVTQGIHEPAAFISDVESVLGHYGAYTDRVLGYQVI